jgi:hypothetical protein
VTTCPRDGKKLRNGVCLVCGYTAPNATMSAKRPAAAGSGTSGWRGRAATTASTPQPAGGSPWVPPVSAPPPSSVPPSAASPPPAPAPPHTPPPLHATHASSTSPAPRPTSGRVVVFGTIADVSPERYDTVRLGVKNALAGATVRLLTIVPKAIGMAFAVVLSLFAPRLGGVVMGMRGGRRYQNDRPDELRVPGTPFVLDGDDGSAFDCYLRGEMRGGAIRLGDRVEVRGRVDPRSRVLKVGELLNTRTGATTRGYVDPSARMPGVRMAVQAVVLLLLILALLTMCGRI